MAELENVIKAWECCDPFNRRCFECPYDSDCFHDSFDRVAIADMAKLLKEQQEKIDGLLEDLATAIDDKESALLMLKEQHPRVLTFDEAIQSEREVLVEIYSPISEKTYIKWCDLCYDGNMSLAMYTTHGIQLISEESYNRLWRVWSDRPTDEQRKDMLWKGGDGE